MAVSMRCFWGFRLVSLHHSLSYTPPIGFDHFAITQGTDVIAINLGAKSADFTFSRRAGIPKWIRISQHQ